jgi:hypothetical protein
VAALGLAAALALTACGKVGPPVAPERRLPAPAAGLAGSVEGRSILLAWNPPRQRVDGTPLRDLAAFRIHRREDPAPAPPRAALLQGDQVLGYGLVATLRLDEPGAAGAGRGPVRWVDRDGLVFGRQYVYVVTTLDGQGRQSAPSERLAVHFLAAPVAPTALTAGPGDGQARLAWEAPPRLVDGSPPAGQIRYVVLRATGPEGPLSPVTPAPVEATTFIDTGLANDTTYRYAVRAVRTEPTGAAWGEPTASVEVTPVDLTPPGPPRDLVAVPSPGLVQLSWRPAPDADVALYAVYRATGDGPLLRIGTVTAPTTVFADRGARAGQRYRYAVTALDRARRPNESPRSNEVEVTPP